MCKKCKICTTQLLYLIQPPMQEIISPHIEHGSIGRFYSQDAWATQCETQIGEWAFVCRDKILRYTKECPKQRRQLSGSLLTQCISTQSISFYSISSFDGNIVHKNGMYVVLITKIQLEAHYTFRSQWTSMSNVINTLLHFLMRSYCLSYVCLPLHASFLAIRKITCAQRINNLDGHSSLCTKRSVPNNVLHLVKMKETISGGINELGECS